MTQRRLAGTALLISIGALFLFTAHAQAPTRAPSNSLRETVIPHVASISSTNGDARLIYRCTVNPSRSFGNDAPFVGRKLTLEFLSVSPEVEDGAARLTFNSQDGATSIITGGIDLGEPIDINLGERTVQMSRSSISVDDLSLWDAIRSVRQLNLEVRVLSRGRTVLSADYSFDSAAFSAEVSQADDRCRATTQEFRRQMQEGKL